MLNAIAGVGMISVGTIGNPAIGAVLDRDFAAEVRAADPALADQILAHKPGIFGESEALDPARRAEFEAAAANDPSLAPKVATITEVEHRTKQGTLGKIAILPTIMLAVYLALMAYFKSKGGYKIQTLVAEPATTRKPERQPVRT